MTSEHSLTIGAVLRHKPTPIGVDVALLDSAQDFLLNHLHQNGMFDELLVFKGGTALRKLFAGSHGRFSVDMDFAIGNIDADRNVVGNLVAELVNGATLGPFKYTVAERRGRHMISVTSELGAIDLDLKLDVGPPPWLTPDRRPFIPIPIHDRYGFGLPPLPTMRLEENLAEKVARLTRVSTARDASDLVWAAKTSPYSQLDRAELRRLSVLKVWVDHFGLDGHWERVASPTRFDPARWLERRTNWDDESIGLLAYPPPSLDELGADLSTYYRQLGDLDDAERRFAACDVGDRAAVIAAISSLPNGGLPAERLWDVRR